MSPNRGSAVADALVAAVLGGIVTGVLLACTQTAARGLRTAAEITMALDLAREQLEHLRLVAIADGSDAPTLGGLVFARTWTVTPGRGAPDRIAVTVAHEGIIRAALVGAVQR